MHTLQEMNPSGERSFKGTNMLQQDLKPLCFNDRVITYKLCNLRQSPFCSKVQSPPVTDTGDTELPGCGVKDEPGKR